MSLPHLKLSVSPSLSLHSPRHCVALDIPKNSRSSIKYYSSFVNSDFCSAFSLYMLYEYFNTVHLNTETDDSEAVLRNRQ